MKSLRLLISILCLSSVSSYAQDSLKSTGQLPYDPLVLNRIKANIVDKGQQFRPSALQKAHTPYPQGWAAFIEISGADASAVHNLLKENVAPEKVAEKFPAIEISDNMLFYQTLGYWKNVQLSRFNLVDLSGETYLESIAAGADTYHKPRTGHWVISYYDDKNPKYDRLTAVFIRTYTKTRNLPKSAVRAIGYADHMIDTTS